MPERLFRRAVAAPPWWNTGKTLVQIVVLWSIFLGLVPEVISRIELSLGWSALCFTPDERIGAVLFVVFSLGGLWSGYTLSWYGRGTPLPLDTTSQLVVRGPYAFIRNPMAFTALGQGVSVGLALGSGAVFAYVLAAELVWNFILRPAEEKDLRLYFGAPYVEYCRQVRCWIPRVVPYRPSQGLADDGSA